MYQLYWVGRAEGEHRKEQTTNTKNFQDFLEVTAVTVVSKIPLFSCLKVMRLLSQSRNSPENPMKQIL